MIGAPETVDRVVASIGNVAITQSEVEAEYRLEMFLEGKPALTAPDAETLARVCDRLIEQRLLAEETAAGGSSLADPPSSARQTLDEVRQRFRGQQEFESALRTLGMSEEEVVGRIAGRENMLRAIEQHFRPAAWPERVEIETYYQQIFVPELARRNAPVPPLDDVEDKIREILVEKKINELLESWLEEMKSTHRVKVHAF